MQTKTQTKTEEAKNIIYTTHKSERIAERGQNTGTSSGVDGEAGSVGL